MLQCSSGPTAARDSALYPRYEALLDLAHRARMRTSIEALSACIANGWRYCANADRWRLVVESNEAVLVIDYDGKAVALFNTTIEKLPAADQKFWRDNIPVHLRHGQFNASALGLAPHLQSEAVSDIIVLPLDAEGRGLRILAEVGSGPSGFSSVDLKFVAAVGDLFAGEISYVLTVEKLTRALQEQANQDALTGIPNRRSFEQQFDKYWRDSIRSNEPLSLLIVDIDHFKNYNDYYGHTEGDSCLKGIAAALDLAIDRPLDFCARIGGEEFAILLPDTPAAGAACVGERLLATVRALAFEHRTNGDRNTATVSIGAATLVATQTQARMALFEAADKALYIAKKNGRDRFWQSATEELQPPIPVAECRRPSAAPAVREARDKISGSVRQRM